MNPLITQINVVILAICLIGLVVVAILRRRAIEAEYHAQVKAQFAQDIARIYGVNAQKFQALETVLGTRDAIRIVETVNRLNREAHEADYSDKHKNDEYTFSEEGEIIYTSADGKSKRV